MSKWVTKSHYNATRLPLTIVGDPYQGWKVYRRHEVVETVDWKQSETGVECDRGAVEVLRRSLSTRVILTKCREQRTGDTPSPWHCHWHSLWHKLNWDSGKIQSTGTHPGAGKTFNCQLGTWLGHSDCEGVIMSCTGILRSEMVIWVLAIIISSGRKRSPLSLQSTCCSAKWINESAIRRNCYSRLRETFPPLLDVILRHISSNDDFSLRFQFGLSRVSRHCLSDSHDQMWVSVSSISLGLISRCSHLTLNVVLPGLLLPMIGSVIPVIIPLASQCSHIKAVCKFWCLGLVSWSPWYGSDPDPGSWAASG